MLFVMYGTSVFSSVFAITERSEMGLYDVPMFMSLFMISSVVKQGCCVTCSSSENDSA